MRRFEEFADHQLCGAVPIKIDQNRPYIRKNKPKKYLKKLLRPFPKKFTSLT